MLPEALYVLNLLVLTQSHDTGIFIILILQMWQMRHICQQNAPVEETHSQGVSVWGGEISVKILKTQKT